MFHSHHLRDLAFLFRYCVFTVIKNFLYSINKKKINVFNFMWLSWLCALVSTDKHIWSFWNLPALSHTSSSQVNLTVCGINWIFTFDRGECINVQYCDAMRFMVLIHIRHHKVSQSVPFFMQHTIVSILLRIRVRGHFGISNTKYHESHYVTVQYWTPSENANLILSWVLLLCN